MKCLCIVIAVFVFGWNSSGAAKTPLQKRIEQRRITTQCIQENKITLSGAYKLTKGDFSDRSEKVQCFVKCYLQKNQMMDDNGELNSEKIDEELQNYVTDINVPEIREKCMAEVTGDNLCEKSFKLVECFWNTAYPEPDQTARFEFIARPLANRPGSKEQDVNEDAAEFAEEEGDVSDI